ncbi:hypothetical protein EP232_01475 [bacterium]|nr:MAG: hypothetical protein EP232_01475 [bacterium]
MTKHIDRITDVAILVLAVALVFQVYLSRPGNPAGMDGVVHARTQSIPPDERLAFEEGLNDARILVDSNGDADTALMKLQRRYPGRHEVWSLSGRYRESVGDETAAIMGYARAVRLNGDYLDDRSPICLAGRVEPLVDRSFIRLKDVQKTRGLTVEEKDLLKTVYFLRRRLAGGCE